MEESRNKKMIVKFGGGGGIGAVVLLGGVLATAAVASAFVGRRNERSSGKDGRRRHQNSSPEINRQSEEDETKSKGAERDAESDNETAFLVCTQSFTLDEKASVGETPGDVEANDEILCLVSPRKLENDAVTGDGFVVVEGDFPPLDEKLHLESQTKMLEHKKTKATEDISHDYSKENKNVEQVYLEEETTEREHNEGEIDVEVTEMQPREEENSQVAVVDNTVEGVHIDQTEAKTNVNMELNTEEKKSVEAIERAKVDLSVDGISSNEEAIDIGSSLSEIVVPESHSEDVEKIMEHENVDDDEKEGVLQNETVETVQEDEVKYIEEKLVKQEKEDNILILKEENGCIVHPTPRNILPILEEMIAPEVANEDRANVEVGENMEVYEKTVEMEVEEGVILPEDVEITKNGTNKEVSESVEVTENGTSMESSVYQTKDDIDDLAGNAEKEVILHDNIEATKDIVNEVVLELNGNGTLVYQVKDDVNDVERNDEKEVEEEVISHENIEATKDDVNEEVLELNENGTLVYQVKDYVNDLVRNDEKEVEEEVISHENIEATKDVVNEEVLELNENGTLVYQVKDDVNDIERNNENEVEEKVISHGNIVNEEDSESTKVEFVVDQPKQNEHDLERNIEDSSDADKTNDESSLSDETEESSLGTDVTSSELNSAPIFPAESPEESSIEPQQAKIINYEIEGKIHEDKTEKEGKVIGKESSFEPHQVKANTFINKYAVDLATLKYHRRSTRRRLIIGLLSVISSFSCSWYFGLSFVKLCLIVFLTAALSEIYGY